MLNVPRPGWLAIAHGTIVESTTDHVALAAAGCAFFATLSLFPAISMLISIYGLVFAPASVVPQLAVLKDMLPPPAYGLIEDRVLQLIAQPHKHLSLSLIVGTLLTFWSSASAAKSLLSAVNVAYDVTERRSFLRFQAIGLAMTLGAMVFASLAIAVLLILPSVIRFSGLSAFSAELIQTTTFLFVEASFAGGMTLLYARGPSRQPFPEMRVLPGVILSTILWLISSWALSTYVRRLANFDATYGSIGAVVGVMLWFYISAYAVLLGAELNARIEGGAAPSRPGSQPKNGMIETAPTSTGEPSR
jgi:membrane protein